jgi:hypothetical protein
MLGLAYSSTKTGARAGRVPRCLTFQQQVRHHKMRADWAFVSGVSAVSANWEIINRRCKRQRELLLAATPCALGQVRHAPMRPAFLVRQRGRDTRGTAETARVCPLLLLSRLSRSDHHAAQCRKRAGPRSALTSETARQHHRRQPLRAAAVQP